MWFEPGEDLMGDNPIDHGVGVRADGLHPILNGGYGETPPCRAVRRFPPLWLVGWYGHRFRLAVRAGPLTTTASQQLI